MKKIFPIFLILIIGFAACKPSADSSDKAAQLAELKKRQAELTTQISALEKELSLSDTTTKTQKVFPISVMALTPSVFNHFVELQGAVVADDEYYLNAKVPGTITKINLKVGDKVRAGQVVAEVDDEMLQQQMNEMEKRYELAKDIFDKQESLWKQNIGSEVQYLSAKNNKEALEKAMSTLAKSREYYKIIIPTSGVVDEVNLRLGQVVSPGIPLAKIVNFSKLKFKADVPESYVGKVRAGNTVQVSFPDLNKEVTGKISYIGSSVNPMNRTVKVEVPLRANEAGLLPNMAGILKVADYTNSNVFSVPINVLKKDLDGRDFVFIESDGKAVKAIVKVGQYYGDAAEILSGIKAGSKLIVNGFEDLTEGDMVKVQ